MDENGDPYQGGKPTGTDIKNHKLKIDYRGKEIKQGLVRIELDKKGFKKDYYKNYTDSNQGYL